MHDLLENVEVFEETAIRVTNYEAVKTEQTRVFFFASSILEMFVFRLGHFNCSSTTFLEIKHEERQKNRL